MTYKPKPVGTCRICGCRDDQVCELENGDACFWLDHENTLCSNPRCVALVPLAELELLAMYRTVDGVKMWTNTDGTRSTQVGDGPIATTAGGIVLP